MNAVINANRTNGDNCHRCNKCNRFHPEVILFLRRFAAAGCLHRSVRIGIIIDVAITLLLRLCIRGSISSIASGWVGTTISSITITIRCGAARCSRCAVRILIVYSRFRLIRRRSCCVVRFVFHHVLFPFIHKNLPFY